MILWASYLLLMFCYDKNFLGDRHPLPASLRQDVCSAASSSSKQLKLSSWGANIRMAIATVIVFWVPVEVLGRLNFFHEFWVEPEKYATQISASSWLFVVLMVYILMAARDRGRKVK